MRDTEALFVAIPNGDERGSRVQARLLDEGLHPGALDVLLVLPQGRVFWAEFKVEADPIRGRKRTYLNKNQEAFTAKLERLAHSWCIIRSPEEWQALLDRLGVKNLIRLW